MPPSTEVRRTLGRIFDCQTKRYGQPRHVVLTKFRSVLGCFDATFRICYFHFRTLSILPLLRREDEAVDGHKGLEGTDDEDLEFKTDLLSIPPLMSCRNLCW